MFLEQCKHTHRDSLSCFHMRCSTVACFVCKGCPDDMMICSRKLTEHRAPEVPAPQRLLWRQPKAYLQAATSHTTICLELVYIIMSSVLKHPNAEIPSGAPLSFLQSLNILHYRSGNMKQRCICWRFVLCLKDKLNKLSSTKWSRRRSLVVSALRLSPPQCTLRA